MTLAPLGSPPRFELKRVSRPTFAVVFEADSQNAPVRYVRRKTFFSEIAAYRWLARRMIFMARDTSCGSYSDADPEDGECRCKYHEERSFRRLETRLARWLRWRDRRCAQPVVSRATEGRA